MLLLYVILVFSSQFTNVLLQNDLDKLRKCTEIPWLQRLTTPLAPPSLSNSPFPASFPFSGA